MLGLSECVTEIESERKDEKKTKMRAHMEIKVYLDPQNTPFICDSVFIISNH